MLSGVGTHSGKPFLFIVGSNNTKVEEVLKKNTAVYITVLGLCMHGRYMRVHMFMCLYVHVCLCVSMCACGSQRLTLGILLDFSHPLIF